MTRSLTTTQLPGLEGLLPLLQRAQVKAAKRGSVLASLTTSIDPGVWPSTLTDGPNFLWEQPERAFALHAIGEATRIVTDGPFRFAAGREALVSLLEHAIVQGSGSRAPTGPICLGAFAFDPTTRKDDAWQDFPDGLVVVPRLLFHRDGEASSLTVNVLIDAATDVAAATERLASQVRAALNRTATKTAADLSITARGDDATWRDSVLSLIDQIAHHRVDKVVLARRLVVEAGRPLDLDAALARLRERYRNCTIFAVRNGDACFLGATPELLVRRDGPRIHADCLAGSAPRGATPSEDEELAARLLADDKERREHALVTQGLRDSLAGLCDDVRIAETPTVRRMANVQHLHTSVEATAAANQHILEFVERLHPTAAVAGLPRDRSLCLIRDQEHFSRGWYAGPIGWLDADGNGEFAVALRSALVRGHEALLFAGCGIVQGSDPDREYEESRIKMAAMLWALSGKS